MTAKTFSPAPRDNNKPSNVSSMYDGGISIETYSAGAGRDNASMVDFNQLEVHCNSTPMYNLRTCRLTNQFFCAFANLIL